MIFNLLFIWLGISLCAIFFLTMALYGIAKQKDEAEARNVIYESALEIKRNTDRI